MSELDSHTIKAGISSIAAVSVAGSSYVLCETFASNSSAISLYGCFISQKTNTMKELARKIILNVLISYVKMTRCSTYSIVAKHLHSVFF